MRLYYEHMDVVREGRGKRLSRRGSEGEMQRKIEDRQIKCNEDKTDI